LEWCLDFYKTLSDWHDTFSIQKYFSELENDSNKKNHNKCYGYTYLRKEKPTFYNCHCGLKKLVINVKKSSVICNSFENGDRIKHVTSENPYK